MSLDENLKKAQGDITIAVVDDELSVLEVLDIQLSDLGYNVLPYLSGKEIIDDFSNGKTADLIILDIFMPEYTGKRVYRELREMGVTSKFLLNTGYLNDEVRDLLVNNNVFFMSKPVTYLELSNFVYAALNSNS